MRTPWFLLMAALALVAFGCNPGLGYDDDYNDDDDDNGGTPDIDVPTDPVALGQVSIAAPQIATMTIENTGDGDLEVHYVTVTDSAGHVVDVEPWHGHLEPGGSVDREVTAGCIDPGELLGVIEIGSNDPDEPTYPVDVTLTCIP